MDFLSEKGRLRFRNEKNDASKERKQRQSLQSMADVSSSITSSTDLSLMITAVDAIISLLISSTKRTAVRRSLWKSMERICDAISYLLKIKG